MIIQDQEEAIARPAFVDGRVVGSDVDVGAVYLSVDD